MAAIRSARIWERLRGHLFETASALGWMVVGVAWLAVHAVGEHSPVGRAVHPLDTVWSLLYIVGGSLVLVSLGFRCGYLNLRVAGLTLLCTGLVMQGIAAVTAPAPDPRVAVYWIYAVACGLRAWLCGREALRRGRHG